MVLWGTIINSVLIILGAIIGRLFKNIPEKIKETVMQVIGLAIIILGIQMGIKSDSFITVIVSLVIGTIIGEWLNIDGSLIKLGQWLEKKISRGKKKGEIAQGFTAATLIFVIGSMAILGALDSGIRNDHALLTTKGLIDGFTSIILASTLGIGVLLSAIPVFLYQGAIALAAGWISLFIPPEALESFIAQMTATGGIMIFAIGLNMMGITKIRVANTLPAIVIVGVIVTIQYIF